mmetsp:Transcript_46888/g.147026  ORF Transcript_46888/g.147026 Transcript_46888/m.147026 type:complete len:281 (+) Transcript_46888:364-1206(+)
MQSCWRFPWTAPSRCMGVLAVAARRPPAAVCGARQASLQHRRGMAWRRRCAWAGQLAAACPSARSPKARRALMAAPSADSRQVVFPQLTPPWRRRRPPEDPPRALPPREHHWLQHSPLAAPAAWGARHAEWPWPCRQQGPLGGRAALCCSLCCTRAWPAPWVSQGSRCSACWPWCMPPCSQSLLGQRPQWRRSFVRRLARSWPPRRCSTPHSASRASTGLVSIPAACWTPTVSSPAVRSCCSKWRHTLSARPSRGLEPGLPITTRPLRWCTATSCAGCRR